MSWHLHWDVALVLLLLGGAYAYGLARLRPGPRWLHPIERRQVVLFFLGILILYLAEGTPLHELSERFLFSAHMVQHMLLIMAVPPLLLLGTPAWLLRPMLAYRPLFPAVQVLTNPIVAIALFTSTLALWHLPNLYQATLENHNVHILNHLTYLFTAIVLWWPVLSPLPELPRLSYPAQMLYLFVQSLVPSVLAAMITFSDTVIYLAYAAAPRIWDITAVQDQQIGGVIMKVLGSLILWLFVAVIFFVWFNHEEAEVEKSWD